MVATVVIVVSENIPRLMWENAAELTNLDRLKSVSVPIA